MKVVRRQLSQIRVDHLGCDLPPARQRHPVLDPLPASSNALISGRFIIVAESAGASLTCSAQQASRDMLGYEGPSADAAARLDRPSSVEIDLATG